MKIRWLSIMLGAAWLAAPIAGAAPSDAGYAPEKTDLLVRIDGRKLLRSKFFAALRTRKKFQPVEKIVRDEVAQAEVSFEEIMDTDLHIFASTVALNTDLRRIDAIARNPKPLAARVLERIDAHLGGDARSKRTLLGQNAVGGRAARQITRGDFSLAVIALEENALQFSINGAEGVLLTASEARKDRFAVDPEAMIGVAFRVDPASGKALKKLLPKMVRSLVKGLKSASAGLYDDGEGLRFEAEFLYSDPKRAWNAGSQIKGVLTMCAISISENDPDSADLLLKVHVFVKDEKVRVRTVWKNGDAIRLGATLWRMLFDPPERPRR